MSEQTTMFQSLDWVDVDFDLQRVAIVQRVVLFQSLDWVDVDFDLRFAYSAMSHFARVSIPRLG